MTEAIRPPDPAAPEIAEAVLQPRRKRGLQLVWIIPLVAALLGGWLAVKTWLERGPTITISFKTGEGLEAGKTKIKYKDVDIGLVKTIVLAEDRSHVIATAEIAREAEAFLAEDTRFWVVRPRVSGSSVTGLSTLLGGAYIGVDIGKSDKRRRAFTGLDEAPLITMDLPGRFFVLRADDLGSLEAGSPVYFRRIQAGQVVSYSLDDGGAGVALKVFINAPYDRYVSANTRFWNVSGVDVHLDASGLRVDTHSLASILAGGIAFQTPGRAGAVVPASADSRFELYPSRELALKHPDTVVEEYTLVFKSSVRGLTVGAPMDFRGIVVGEVKSISLEFDPQSKSFVSLVEVRFYPERLSARMHTGSPEPRELISDLRERMDEMVANGLRGQLRSASLLTGQLYVAIDFIADAPQATMDWEATPPRIPTVSNGLDELQASLNRIASRLEKVPFDAIGADLRQALQTLDRTMKSTNQLIVRIDHEIAPELRSAVGNARRTLETVEHSLASDAPLQQGVHDTLHEVSRAAASLRALTDYLERHPEALIRGKKEDLP